MLFEASFCALYDTFLSHLLIIYICDICKEAKIHTPSILQVKAQIAGTILSTLNAIYIYRMLLDRY